MKLKLPRMRKPGIWVTVSLGLIGLAEAISLIFGLGALLALNLLLAVAWNVREKVRR